MNTKTPVASYYPCPIKASSIFAPQPPPVPMYYARDPVRLTFEDADWGPLTDDEDSESEQELSSHSTVPIKPFLPPRPAEMSTRNLHGFRKTLSSAMDAPAEAKACGKALNIDQRQRPTPTPAALQVSTHKGACHLGQKPETSCRLSRSKVKHRYFVDTNERRQSVPHAAFILPKGATRSLPPAFSDSDDECDDPLATRMITTGGKVPKQNGKSETNSTAELGRCMRN